MYSTNEILSIVRNSGVLGKTGRQYKLLEYLLEKKEQGQAEDIKAYSIALDVFERPSTFDNSQDSIVRVEMFRLRKNLKAFNSTSKDLTLDLPNASYLIEVKGKERFFGFRKFSLKNLITVSLLGLGVLLSASYGVFQFYNTNLKYSSFCSTHLPNVAISTDTQIYKSNEIVNNAFRAALAQQTGINLVGRSEKCDTNITPFYIIEIDTVQIENKTNVSILTSHRTAGNVVHSSVIDEAELNQQVEDSLYYAAVYAANDLAKMNGIIPRHAARLPWGAVLARSNYNCIIVMYDSFVSDSDSDYLKSLKCLEGAVEGDNPPLANIGTLATAYIVQKKGIRENTIPNPFERSEQLLEGIGESWVEDVETVVAKIHFEAVREDFSSERLKDTLNIAQTHYPLNPQILTTLSIMYGFSLGDWEHAKTISDFLKRVHSERDNSVFIVDAVYALLTSSPNDVMKKCILAESKSSLISNLVIYACASVADDTYWIVQSRVNLSSLGYQTPEDMVKYIISRNYDPVFTKKIIEAVRP